MRNNWTEDEIEILKKDYSILGTDIKVNHTKNSIQYKANKLGLKVNKDITSKRMSNSALGKPKTNLCGVDYKLFMNPSPEIAYLLGLFWGDGYLFNNKTKGIVIESLTEDLINLEYIFNMTGKWSKSKRTRKNRTKECTILRTNNLNLYNYLCEYNYNKKSFISSSIQNSLKEDLEKYWWRGYFDADGCMYINYKRNTFVLSFASSYEQDWTFVENLFKKLNCKYSIVRKIKKIGGKYSTISVFKRESCIDILKYIYDGKIFGLSRKYKKFKDALDIIVNYNSRICV